MNELQPPPPQPIFDPPVPQRRPMHWWLRKLFSAVLLLAVGISLIALVGLAQRWGWLSSGGSDATASRDTTSEQTYTCSMHPQIRQPTPGRCPICGMELVVATGAVTDLDDFSVHIEPAQRRLAQISTAPVRVEAVTAQIQSIGAIAIDESRMATISSYISGRIERLFADYTGVDVAKGDHLAIVYSPQLYSAQVEYLEARKAMQSMTPSTLEIVRQTQQKLVESARHRLVELGMTSDQLAALEESNAAQSRLTVYTPTGGTVIQKLAVEGDYLEAGQPIYRIANLSTVWLMLELFPEDASRIRFGQQVDAEIQSLPGEIFHGRVAFIDPTVDARRRTVGVRVEFLNEDRRLRPGDYATATVHLPVGPQGEVYDEGLAGKWISPMHPQIIREQPGACPICGMDLIPTTRFGYAEQPVPQPMSIVVPRSAVLMAGSNSVVYVEKEPGRFEIRPVLLGPILREKVIVLEGLQEGELVATAGNFLIDSQMQLSGKPSLIDPTRAIAARKTRNTPLKFPHVHVMPLAGSPGESLEELYAAYFRIQQTLANDEKPEANDVSQLRRLALSLAEEAGIDDTSRQKLKEIAQQSEHLHHLSLEKARLESFRPLSHAIVGLATLIRGEAADTPFVQMYCPMVEGGAGDWLQDNRDLRNPYWGSKMLTCGDVVLQFPVRGHVDRTPTPESAAPVESTPPSAHPDEN